MNIVQILKQCDLKRIELWSPLVGKIKNIFIEGPIFRNRDYYSISGSCELNTAFYTNPHGRNLLAHFTMEGLPIVDDIYPVTGKCMLFPSETCRDWNQVVVIDRKLRIKGEEGKQKNKVYTLIFKRTPKSIQWHHETFKYDLHCASAGTTDKRGLGWVSTGITFRGCKDEGWVQWIEDIVGLFLKANPNITDQEILVLTDYLTAFHNKLNCIDWVNAFYPNNIKQ